MRKRVFGVILIRGTLKITKSRGIPPGRHAVVKNTFSRFFEKKRIYGNFVSEQASNLTAAGDAARPAKAMPPDDSSDEEEREETVKIADAELVKLCRDGDMNAFGMLVADVVKEAAGKYLGWEIYCHPQ